MQIISKKELEAEIVSVRGKHMFTNSLKYSEEFKQTHRDILKKINSLTSEYKHTLKWFKKEYFINERNREFPYYEMTRDGYIFLIMQMGRAKNKDSRDLFVEKQTKFIDAFNKMEQMLLQQQNTEWVESRSQSKIARREETDTIQKFIEYATEQGSSKAKFYYKHFTKATYKALSLLERKNPLTRDTLNLMQLYQLVVAENIVKNVIKNAMVENVFYKDIYEMSKEALDKYAESINIKAIKD